VEKEGEWVDGKRVKWLRKNGVPVDAAEGADQTGA